MDDYDFYHDPALKPVADAVGEHVTEGNTKAFTAWFGSLAELEQRFAAVHLANMVEGWDEVLDEHIKEARYEYSPKIIDEAINNSLENKARAEEYLSLCPLLRLRGIPPEQR